MGRTNKVRAHILRTPTVISERHHDEVSDLFLGPHDCKAYRILSSSDVSIDGVFFVPGKLCGVFEENQSGSYFDNTLFLKKRKRKRKTTKTEGGLHFRYACCPLKTQTALETLLELLLLLLLLFAELYVPRSKHEVEGVVDAEVLQERVEALVEI